MVDDGKSEMTRQDFSIAYNGSARADIHTIDVEALSPALLAVGRLIREASKEVNGKKATTKVLVKSDFEHKCFYINFELLSGAWEQVRALIGMENVKSAKELLEWIGLVKPTVVGSLSFLAYLQLKNGRNVDKTMELVDKDQAGTIVVHIAGDGNTVNVDKSIFNLSQNPAALKATRDILSPIGQDGFDRMELRDNGSITETIDAEATKRIVSSCNSMLLELGEDKPEITSTSAWLTVYSPVFDPASKVWEFKYGGERISADISETSIASETIRRGQSCIEDAYHVKLEVTTPRDSKGKPGKPSYKILKVIHFVPAPPTAVQQELFATRSTTPKMTDDA